MTALFANPSGLFLRAALALALTAGLLVFLAAMRLSRTTEAPTLTLRTLESIDPVSLPAPPPPPPTDTPPPPPPVPDLPRLDLALDPVAPPLQATLSPDPDLRLNMADFAPQTETPRQSMTFAASDLDSHPRLVNRPSVTFPPSQKNRGVTEGRVTLEVVITSSGSVEIKRVLETSHADFTAMARSFASGAKFTPPKKDGRAVHALFRWPLILRP